MMGLGKPQLHAEFEVAGFIYYGNIRKFVFFLIGISQNGETFYFSEKLTLTLDSQTQCFLFNVQHLWSYDCRKWVIFYEKPHFTMESFTF